MTAAAPKPYFPNLDALRFLAATSVLLAHAWLHIDTTQMSAHWVQTFRHHAELGVLGVNFFFVLSGFLITYLMLHEKTTTGQFSTGRYYMRRILRIWPLFFMLLFISFVVTPLIKYALHQPYTEAAHPLWYVFFINNFHDIIYGQPHAASLASLWTIAVEEQFYVFFPLMMLLPSRTKIAWPVLIVIVSLLFRACYIHDSKILYMHTLSVIGDFGVGSLLAFFVFKKNRLFYSLTNAPHTAIAGIYIVLLLLLAFDYRWFNTPGTIIFERLTFAVVFAAIIFEQVFCVNSLFKFGTWQWMNYGGKISYGIYCYQYFAIIPVYYALVHWHIYEQPIGFLVLHPLLSVIGAYVLAAVSYRFYEAPFLKLKKVFYPKS